MATVFLADSFTEAADTSLSAHAPETGGAWSAFGAPYTAAASVLAAEGRVAGSSSSSSALYTNTATPPSADYLVEAVVRFASSTGKRVGLAARYSAIGAENGYLVFYDGLYWVLRKVVAGVGVDLGSYRASPVLNTDYVLRLEVFGATLTVSIDGVARIVATDDSITAAGRVGLLLRSGGQIDSLTVSTLEPRPTRLTQTTVEAALRPEPAARLTQALAEILTQASVPSRLTQLLVETLVLPFAPALLDQAAVEVLWRDPRLAGDVGPTLAGVATLDLGLALAGAVEAGAYGAGVLELGTEFSPAPGAVTTNLAAHLAAVHRLGGELTPRLAGRAELLLGEEFGAPGRVALIVHGRLAGDAPATSAFWLLF